LIHFGCISSKQSVLYKKNKVKIFKERKMVLLIATKQTVWEQILFNFTNL
jgi:hypothetical protein